MTHSVIFLWLWLADRAEWFPQIQRADMPSFRAANAFIKRLFANLTYFHYRNYIFLASIVQ